MRNTPRFLTTPWTLLFAAALTVATLVACGGSSGASTDGTLKLAMTDSPGCGYDHVYITVDKIRVHQSAAATDSDSGWYEITPPSVQRIDLLSLTNGALQELGSLPLPAGRYQQVRLVLSDAAMANAIRPSGSNTDIQLDTPSASQSGYKLQAQFDVTGNQVADMVLDFDACKSIVRAGASGHYKLKPVVAVTPRLTTQIEGYVAPEAAPDVVVSTRDPDKQLRATVPDSNGKFVIAYLPENTQYTVVISGAGRTTLAVTDVPVSTAIGRTRLNDLASAITVPTSTTATVQGKVTDALLAPLVEASVTAQQTLSTQQMLDVAWTLVDPVTAQYTLTLPLTAPQKASYVSNGGPLTFTVDSLTPGIYNIQGSAPGYSTQLTLPETTLGAAGSSTSKDLELAP